MNSVQEILWISQNLTELCGTSLFWIRSNFAEYLMPLPAANKNSGVNLIRRIFREHPIPHMVRSSETVHVWKVLWQEGEESHPECIGDLGLCHLFTNLYTIIHLGMTVTPATMSRETETDPGPKVVIKAGRSLILVIALPCVTSRVRCRVFLAINFALLPSPFRAPVLLVFRARIFALVFSRSPFLASYFAAPSFFLRSCVYI